MLINKNKPEYTIFSTKASDSEDVQSVPIPTDLFKKWHRNLVISKDEEVTADLTILRLFKLIQVLAEEIKNLRIENKKIKESKKWVPQLCHIG